MPINIQFADSATVKLNLDRLVNAIKDMKPVFQEIGKMATEDFQSNMESGNTKRSFGGAWSPLSASTKTARAKRQGYYKSGGFGAKPLIWTGRLRDGIKTKEATKDKVVVGNDVHYYKYHQMGTSKMPARKMIGIEKRLVGNYVEIINKHFRKAMKNG